MAAKKAKAKGAKAAAPKQAKAPAKRDSVAVKLLGTLPALSSKLRAAFRAAYTDEQCDAWGQETKAENVVREAQKWLVTMDKALKADPDVTYSRRRLAYLCELVVLLEDEVARTTDTAAESLRLTRNSALAVAANAQRDLTRRLYAMAGGQEALRKVVAERTGSLDSPSEVQDSLTELIDLAVKWRRNEVMEALADDVGITEDRLNAAYSALESLTGASDVALNAAAYEGDAPSVNRVEGRVLRELRAAQLSFRDAREAGVNVPALVAAPSLGANFTDKKAKSTPVEG